MKKYKRKLLKFAFRHPNLAGGLVGLVLGTVCGVICLILFT